MEPERRCLTRKELSDLAREALGRTTQIEAAKRLDVSQPAISQALKGEDPALDSLRIRIIETYTQLHIERGFVVAPLQSERGHD